MIQFSEPFQKALADRAVHEKYLLEITLGAHTLRYVNTDIDYDFRGYYYIGGLWKGGASPKITSEPKLNACDLEFTGLAPEVLSIPLRENYMNAPVKVTRVCVHRDSRTFLNAYTVYQGCLSGYEFDEDNADAQLTLTATSIWAALDQKAGRRSNSASQQRFYPNDKGFDFAPITLDNLPWGRAK